MDVYTQVNADIREAARAWADAVERRQSTGYLLPARDFLTLGEKYFPGLTQNQLLHRAQKYHVPTNRLDWRGMYMTGSYFSHLDLTENNFDDCTMRDATFDNCNLTDAKFRQTDLTSTTFRQCRLEAVNWAGAQLKHTCLWTCIIDRRLSQAALFRTTQIGTCASADAGPILLHQGLRSGPAAAWQDHEGTWCVGVGCWSGSVADLRKLISRDDDWPEAVGEEIDQRRPSLEAFCDLVDAHIEFWENYD